MAINYRKSDAMAGPVIFSTVRETPDEVLIGGWADRLKGVCFCAALARLLGREFEIYWPNNETELPLQTRGVKKLGNLPKSNSSYQYFDLIDYRGKPQAVVARRLLHLHNEKAPLVININSIGFEILSDARRTLTDLYELSRWNEASLFQAVYESVFYKRPEVESKVSGCMLKSFEEFRMAEGPLIGVHFRCGGWGNWQDPVLDHPQNAVEVSRAAKTLKSKVHHKGCNFFIASDNPNAKAVLVDSLASDGNMFYFDVVPHHFERSERKGLAENEAVVVEHYALSCCDYIVCGEGEFGVTAAYIGGSDFFRYWDLVTIRLISKWRLIAEKKKRKVIDRLSKWRRRIERIFCGCRR